VVFAVVPYLWFRRRYSAAQLNPRSTNRTKDLLVIVVVAVIESLVELGAFPGIFQLSARQLLIAAPLAFGVFMIGTVLPTMVLIYAILIPRYLKLTGSSATTVILGGVTYAAMHIVEGWSVFTTPRDIALSLIFVVLAIFWPGHDEDSHNSAHRQRLGPRHRLPRHPATRGGRYPAGGQGIRPEVSCRRGRGASLLLTAERFSARPLIGLRADEIIE
jgi:hypothetical protein